MKIFFEKDKSIHLSDFYLRWFLCQCGYFVETNPDLFKECSLVVYYGDINKGNPEILSTMPIIHIPFENLPVEKVIGKKAQWLYMEEQVRIPVWGHVRDLMNTQPFLEKRFRFDFTSAAGFDSANSQLKIAFDVFSNLFFHLHRLEEKDFRQSQAKPFYYENSILKDSLKVPVVDYLIQFTDTLIETAAGHFVVPLLYKKRWPLGKKFTYSISHDIDLTRKWGPKTVLLNIIKWSFTFRLKKVASMLYEFVMKSNSYWTFPKLIELYAANDWKVTFFFIAKPWEKLSYRYNIAATKFRNLFKELLNNHHEVELHTSLNSFGHLRTVKNELYKLKYFSDSPIYGVRQHYLKLDFPEAFSFFRSAHFKYDSSMAYSETAGFRAGTSLPYVVRTDEDKSIYEIPFLFFDYHLKGMENVETEIEEYLNKIRQVNGLFHFLFHPSNLAEEPYAEYFYKIVRTLFEKYPDAINMSLGQIREWCQNRDNIRLAVYRDSEKPGFIIEVDSLVSLSDLVLTIKGMPLTILINKQSGSAVRALNGANVIVNLEPGNTVQLIVPDNHSKRST